jgi:hypothetical protein
MGAWLKAAPLSVGASDAMVDGASSSAFIGMTMGASVRIVSW